MALSEAKWIVLRSLGVIFFSLVAAVLITAGCAGLSIDETLVVRSYELGFEETISWNTRVIGVMAVLVGIVFEVIALVLTGGRVPFVILFGLSLVLNVLLFIGSRGFVFAIEAGAIAPVIGAFYFLLKNKFVRALEYLYNEWKQR